MTAKSPEEKNIKQEVIEIIREYKQVLKNTAKRTYGVPESTLPHSKKVIKSAIKASILMTDDKNETESLKTGYISLANFIPDTEANKAQEISQDHFSFLEMDEDKKVEFLKERFKSGLIGDYEQAIRITAKIAQEQKHLRQEIEEFLKECNIDYSP